MPAAALPRLRAAIKPTPDTPQARPLTDGRRDAGPARATLLEAAERLRVWRRGGQRAPHKPLLVLLMLGRLARGDGRLVAFTDVEDDLRGLLADFGPPRQSHHPEFPFWHLRSDGVWEVQGDEALAPAPGASPSPAQARRLRGGFPADLWQLLRDDPALVTEVAARLLWGHFAPSLHEDILARVGLDEGAGPLLRHAQRRDPAFRLEVLRAYGYRCAVCGYDGQVDTTSVGLDAAHVRWWALRGPDALDNALALCVLHHKALDLGVIGVTGDLRVQVSQAFRGGARAHEYVTAYAGRPLLAPQAGLPTVHERHRAWHEREVFRAPPRTATALAADSPAPYEPGP